MPGLKKSKLPKRRGRPIKSSGGPCVSVLAPVSEEAALPSRPRGRLRKKHITVVEPKLCSSSGLSADPLCIQLVPFEPTILKGPPGAMTRVRAALAIGK